MPLFYPRSRYPYRMASRPQILASAQAQFPPSANKSVSIDAAFRPSDSSTGVAAPNGMDGWTSGGGYATYENLSKLRAEGFTKVSLTTGGTANNHKDVWITDLI